MVVKKTNKKQVKQVKKTVKPQAKQVKKPMPKKNTTCKKCKCVKPVKVSLNDVKVTTPKVETKKTFWTKVKEFFGF